MSNNELFETIELKEQTQDAKPVRNEGRFKRRISALRPWLPASDPLCSFKSDLCHGYTKEWKSWKIRGGTLLSLSFVTICMIAAILALDTYARANSGFKVATSQSNAFASFIWQKGYLWTILPTLLFSIYRILIDAIVSASSDRQPFVELGREEGSSPEKSVLLDYRTYSPGQREYRAFRNKHYHLLLAFILSFVLGVAVLPLSAHLLFELNTTIRSTVTVQQDTFFDSTGGYSLSIDLLPIYDTVAATLIYGGSYPAWTDSSNAYQPFSIPPTVRDGTQSANVTAVISAQSASLSCVDLDAQEHNLSVRYTPSSTAEGEIFVTAIDRGCPININFPEQARIKSYLQTFDVQTCSPDAELSRLVVIGAVFPQNSPTQPSTFTALSCIPSYASTRGKLEVKIGIDGIPVVQSFSPTSDSNVTKPEWWRSFELQLQTIQEYDSYGTVSETVLGRLIIALAGRDYPHSFLQAHNLINATSSVFQSTYAILAAADFYKPALTPILISATLYSSETRLLVSSPVAYTIVGVLVAILALLVWTQLYARQHRSILYEEPVGLLGHAAVSTGGDMLDIVQATRDEQEFDGRVLAALKGHRSLAGAQCRFVQWDHPSESHIVVTYSENFFREARDGRVKSG